MQTRPLTTLRLVLAFSFGAPFLHGAANDSDRWATLEAIHNLENPRDLTRPGPCGELGAYQFREITWKTYTAQPFRFALDRHCSDVVAMQHYDWIKQRLECAHIPATSYNIALAWNGGLHAVITGSAPRRARDYAERAANLATVFAKESLVATAR